MIDHANSLATGANLPRLSPSSLAGIEVPVAPVSEQRRIAAILDQADGLRQRRHSLIQLDHLVTSTFIGEFGNFEEKPSRWPVTPFQELVADTKLGLVRSASEMGENRKYVYVRMNSITSAGELDLSVAKRVDATPLEATAFELRPGDFLFNTRNSRELVGKTALFRGFGSRVLFNNNVLRIRLNDAILPSYLAQAFRSSRVKRDLEGRKSGTTSVFAIYYKDLATLPIPVPPISTQKGFAKFLDAFEETKFFHHRALTELDALFASLQHRAFRGEL